MGAVYRATRLLIGDEVAIKILHVDRADANSSERFRREAQAAARLKHPNAVSIYDFGVSTDGLQYLVMEFLEGESLRQKTRLGSIDLSTATEITSQVCAALDEAHRRHIIHRDIKPDNIILESTPTGIRVKVLDFGIAKLRDDTASHITQTGSVMGTPHYMSPEQCLGEELDPRADIYSAGIVLYEMLCGRVPFNSPISTAVVVQHVSQPPPSLRSINPAVPASIEAVVLHAIQKSRDARPVTAGAWALELRMALQHAGAPATSYSGFGLQSPVAFPPDTPINEETVERGKPASRPQPGLPKTIHLAGLRPDASIVGSGRQTAESNAAMTASLKRAIPIQYVGGALLILFAGALIAFFLWPRGDRSDDDAVAVNSNPAGGNSVTNSSQPSSGKPQRTENPAPPAGMAAVTGGQFLMGSNDGDPDSRPAHMVSVRSFYLDVNEVTRDEYKKFVEATGHRVPANWGGADYPAGTSRHPVTAVTWDDAVAYAQWAGKRLPTEEEWEFAARGGSGLRYPWGDQWKAGCANADAEGKHWRGLVSVGGYNCGSPFGIKDLIGNAWEWTASDWVPYPGGRLADRSTVGKKVIRGGSWESDSNYASTTYRSGYTGVGEMTGFRCAKDIP